ncbi:LysR family transcriptional regulator [Acidothermaceae bacterium B102]|nr:LysR family transcriptional regulator [Acidothermaceae bacterium B102]
MSGRADGVELAHLRLLVALADEGTFTDAAIRLGLSQSATSRALARFEAALGVELVRRTTRSLVLTDAGRTCYAAAVEVLRGVDALVDATRGQVGPLRLGYSWAALGPYTSDVLRAWRDEHPDVALEVHRVDERSAGLTSGAVDVAIRRDHVDEPGVRVEAVFDEGRMAAVPAVSVLATRATLTLADLTGEVIALVPAIGTTTMDLWPASGRPARSVEVTNTDEWLMAIASGEAVGVTPESTPTQHPHPGVRFVPMPEAPRLTVTLVWPATHAHPALAAFVATVHRCVAATAAARPR